MISSDLSFDSAKRLSTFSSKDPLSSDAFPRKFLVRLSTCSFNSSTLSVIESLIFLRVFFPLSGAKRIPKPTPTAVPAAKPNNYKQQNRGYKSGKK